MIQGGGKWPGRLLNSCSEYVGEVGDEELYAMHREKTLVRSPPSAAARSSRFARFSSACPQLPSRPSCAIPPSAAHVLRGEGGVWGRQNKEGEEGQGVEEEEEDEEESDEGRAVMELWRESERESGRS